MEEDTIPLQPERFFFTHNEFGKSCKFTTRCDIFNTVEALKQLSKSEMKWFYKHKQFKHIWHLERQNNNMVQGMWMLFLRTACTQKKKVCWFVVNGVPIRYSMREHALITGLDCHEYPPGFNVKEYGSYEFVDRIFKTRKVRVKDVEAKLKSMKNKQCDDRLTVAVLLFLAKVIRGNRKWNIIDSFILRIVNGLRDVKTFPWGRLTFEDHMKNIAHTMKKFNGKVKDKFVFPGFIVPLEVKSSLINLLVFLFYTICYYLISV